MAGKLLNKLTTWMGINETDEDDEDSYYDEEEETSRRGNKDNSGRRDSDSREDRQGRRSRYDDDDDRYDEYDRYDRNERSSRSDRNDRNDRSDRNDRGSRDNGNADTASRNTYTPNSARRTSGKESAPAGEKTSSANGMKMIVYHPVTYEDTQHIIDNVNRRKPVIVNMEDLEMETAQRILDFLSGAIYAIHGNLSKISRGIFVAAPNNCDIIGNNEDGEEYDE